jgi:Uncharacterized protein conserved in bacteria (DUF2184)
MGKISTIEAGRAAFMMHRDELISKGISWHEPGIEPYGYMPDNMSYDMAMDALPTLVTAPNVGIPTMLTTWIDPEVYRVVFAPLMAAEIIGDERRRGDWADQTAMFPIAEATGETTAYGDYNEGNADSDVNANWPQRQQFLFQAVIQYGDLEVDRYAKARLNLASEKQIARARNLNTFMNTSYFFGIAGLQNYGLVNDPLLSAALTPGPKAYSPGATAWQVGTQTRATANEIFADIQSVITQAVSQTAGTANQDSNMTLSLGPISAMALTATNSFNVNVEDMLKKNFPNMKVKKAVQYQSVSGSNPQGSAGGNFMQVIVHEVEGQKTGFCAFGEKLRAFPIIRRESSYRQKAASGSWGTVYRFPAGVASMLGI